MKKLVLKVWCAVIFLVFLLPFAPALAEDPIIESIDQKLQAADPYYQKGSAKVMDFTDTSLAVAIGDEETEKQKVKMVFVRYQNDRDTLFHFNKQEIFYYSLDKNTLLELDNVIGNNDSKAFIAEHEDDYRKHITTGSLFLLLFSIFAFILVFPLLVVLFHKNASSDELYHYEL